MTKFITECVTLAIIISQTSCYTFVNPNKVFGQSLPPARPWPEMFRFPLRSYQPPVPLQFLRYYGDAYYPRNLHNRNYFFSHDTYDDGDYPNIFYYLPSGRSTSFYEQAITDPIEELPDYEDELSEERLSKAQRDWWLDKNVAPNEDTDVSQLIREDDLYGGKSAVSKIGPTQPPKGSRKAVSKSHYAGMAGFGHKNDIEKVSENYHPSARKDERTSVYGKQVPYVRNDDANTHKLNDLKLILQSTTNKEESKMYGDSRLSSWANGDKRSGGKTMTLKSKEDFSKDMRFEKTDALKSAKQANTFSVYDEGGLEVVPKNNFDESKWKSYAPGQTSVFDTIKTLLALEDEVETNHDGKTHKLLKRKPPAYKPPVKNKSSDKDRSRNQYSTTEFIPTSKVPGNSPPQATTSPISRTDEKSPAMEESNSKSKLFYGNEDSLVRELSAARRQNS